MAINEDERRKRRLDTQSRYRIKHKKQRSDYAKKTRRNRHLKNEWLEWYIRRYNITIEDYKNMWEKQGGVCGIRGCSWALDSGPKRPHIDHDHDSGRFRGLLCYRHNIALGLVNDNIEQLQGLIDYLGAS